MGKAKLEPAEKAGDPSGDTPTKGKIGRPTLYKPEYCDRAVELGAKGYSQAMIIADIGAGSRETIDNWKKRHPDFLGAMTRARDLARAWWERIGLENAGNRDFNSNLYRVIMMARFGQDGYREKQVIETVQVASGTDLRQLSSEEREQLAALLQKAKTPPTPDTALPTRTDPAADVRPDAQGSRGSVH
jgi:transposase